jgi:hypothetical protein
MVETDPTPIRIDDWRWVVDAMPQLVWVADRTGKILYFNRQVHDVRGRRRERRGAWEWAAAVHPDDAKRSARAWRSALETGAPFLVEHRLNVSDGEYRWHVSHAESTTLGDGPRLVGHRHRHPRSEAHRTGAPRERNEVPRGRRTGPRCRSGSTTSRATRLRQRHLRRLLRDADPTEFEGERLDRPDPSRRPRAVSERVHTVRARLPPVPRSGARPATRRVVALAGVVGVTELLRRRQVQRPHRHERRRQRAAAGRGGAPPRPPGRVTSPAQRRVDRRRHRPTREESSTRTQAQILADRLVSTFADQVTVVARPLTRHRGRRPRSGRRSDSSLGRRSLRRSSTNADEPGQLTVARIERRASPSTNSMSDFLQNLAGRVGVFQRGDAAQPGTPHRRRVCNRRSCPPADWSDPTSRSPPATSRRWRRSRSVVTGTRPSSWTTVASVSPSATSSATTWRLPLRWVSSEPACWRCRRAVPVRPSSSANSICSRTGTASPTSPPRRARSSIRPPASCATRAPATRRCWSSPPTARRRGSTRRCHPHSAACSSHIAPRP